MAARILLAEDSETLGQIVRIKLHQAGYKVDWQRDGDAAWSAIQKDHPDLAILDVMMPLTSGFEVLKNMKQSDATRNIPVIMMTARAMEDDVRRGIEGGASDYVIKPFKPDDLMVRVKRLCPVGAPASVEL